MFELHPVIFEFNSRSLNIGQAMRLLIDRAEDLRPSGEWSFFRTLDYEQDAARLAEEWFPSVLAGSPPVGAQVGAIAFSIFQPIVEKHTVADFFVGGARQFVEDETGSGWVMESDWMPANCIAQSAVLREVYRLAYRGGASLGNDAEEPLCLGFVCFALNALFGAADRALIVDAHGKVEITIGWTSGAPLHVGTLSADGFVPVTAAAANAKMARQKAVFKERFKGFRR